MQGCTAYAVILNGKCKGQVEAGGTYGTGGTRPSAGYYGLLMYQQAVGSGATLYPVRACATGETMSGISIKEGRQCWE